MSATDLDGARSALVDLYRQLTQGKEPEAGDWDQPFLAGRGARYGGSDPRILFVGKATGGWSDVHDCGSARSIAERSDAFLAEISEEPFSAFWFHVDRVGREVAKAVGRHWEHPIAHVGWTNLARIGFRRGNPEGSAFKRQKDVCARLLTAEIDWLRSDLIVLLTHNYQHRFVSDFFGTVGWQDLRDSGHKDAWVGSAGDRLVVWAAHPQGKATTRLETQALAIASKFRTWWERRQNRDPE